MEEWRSVDRFVCCLGNCKPRPTCPKLGGRPEESMGTLGGQDAAPRT